MTIVFDDSYLNRTVNKAPRSYALRSAPNGGYLGVLCHETAGNRANPRGTLDYNLHERDPHDGHLIQSSYDYLIAADGTIYRYVDSRLFTSYHAGVSHWTVNGTRYQNYAVNEITLSVEVDGPNDGTPALPAQIDAFGELALYIKGEFGIPLDRDHYPYHYEVAPLRKTDPRGYSRLDIFGAAARTTQRLVYLTTTTAANLRQGPARSFPVVRVLPAGDVAGYDGDTIGESIGGNNVWKHRGDGLGFVHSSLLRAV